MSGNAGMVLAWVGKKLLNVTFQEFLRCPIFALGPQFHKNRDILEVVHYNVKLLSPYCPESFDRFVNNNLPGKLFFLS